jgi:hypothetical protein
MFFIKINYFLQKFSVAKMPKSVFVFRRTAPLHIWRAGAAKFHYVVVGAPVHAEALASCALAAAAAVGIAGVGSQPNAS